MKIQLPPKRFEEYDDPKFDSIRPRKWFWRLRERRMQLPKLRAAKALYREGMTLESASLEFGLKVKDLADYVRFSEGKELEDKNLRRTAQAVLDEAYEIYCSNDGEASFNECLMLVSPRYGLKGRNAIDYWETDPHLIPIGA